MLSEKEIISFRFQIETNTFTHIEVADPVVWKEQTNKFYAEQGTFCWLFASWQFKSENRNLPLFYHEFQLKRFAVSLRSGRKTLLLFEISIFCPR